MHTYACAFLDLAEPLAARVTSEQGALRDEDSGARKQLGGNPGPRRDPRRAARSTATDDRLPVAFKETVDIVLIVITRANALARCLPRMHLTGATTVPKSEARALLVSVSSRYQV